MKKAIIAAPFGSYTSLANATSTRGTYTWDRRPGAIWGVLTRIHFTKAGIVNKMGMRNPGILSQNFAKHPDAIWSLGGFGYLDWHQVMFATPEASVVELNFSCPNVSQAISSLTRRKIISAAVERFKSVIIKLPCDPLRAASLLEVSLQEGVRIFHCCNTIKVERGGLSGRAIQRYSLPLVNLIKRESGTEVIGGGGNYTPDDIKRYRDVGADYFSLGTVFMRNPWAIPAIMKEIYSC